MHLASKNINGYTKYSSYYPLERGENREELKQRLQKIMAYGVSDEQQVPKPRIERKPPALPTAKEIRNECKYLPAFITFSLILPFATICNKSNALWSCPRVMHVFCLGIRAANNEKNVSAFSGHASICEISCLLFEWIARI